MPGSHEAQIRLRVSVDDAQLKSLPNGFRPGINAANDLANAATKAGAAIDGVGKKAARGGALGGGGGGGIGALGQGFRQMRMGAAMHMASNVAGQVSQFVDPSSHLGMGLSIGQSALSGAASGGMAFGPIGAAVGAASSAIIQSFTMLKATTDQLEAAWSSFKADIKEGQTAVARHADAMIEALNEIDQRGFSQIERDALARLLAEQEAGKKAGISADVEDIQSRGDQMIVELARIRELNERLVEYGEKTGHTLEILKRTQLVAQGAPVSSGSY